MNAVVVMNDDPDDVGLSGVYREVCVWLAQWVVNNKEFILTSIETSMDPVVTAEECLVFLDVDTQVDFIMPQGSLYMPDAASICSNLKRLVDHAVKRKILLLQATDSHVVDDPEFAAYGFPPHCVVGTPGHERVAATRLAATLVIPNVAAAYAGLQAEDAVIRIEKQAFSVASNPNFAALIQDLKPCRVVVFGVATEVCVRQSVLSLLDMDVPVSMVIDAVGHLSTTAGEAAIEELAGLGVRMVSTADVCDAPLRLS